MKTLFVFLNFMLLFLAGTAQRYLTSQFTSVDSFPNQQYGSAINYKNQNENLLFDFYEPRGDVVTERPLIIIIHGGGFIAGHRKLYHLKQLCIDFAKKGYATASISYRLDTAKSGTGLYTASMRAMHDARSAVRYFKRYHSLYGIDTTKIFIGGESAGGITAAAVTYIDKIAEIYPYVLPYTVEGGSGNPGFTSKVTACLELCGFMWDVNEIETATDPPLMIAHGTADLIVSYNYALLINGRATTANLPHVFHTFYGATHCPWFTGLPNWNLYYDSLVTYTTDFLYPFVSTTSIESIAPLINLKIEFTNPVNAILECKLQYNEQAPVKIDLIDMQGKEAGTVFSQTNYTGDTIFHYDCSGLLKGLYLLKVQARDQLLTRKVILE